MPKRSLIIDFLRGLAIILMTLDHTRDMFHSFVVGNVIGVNTPNAIFFTRWITHFCAPLFIFLSGISAYLNFSGKNFSKKEAQNYLIKRGIFLIVLEFLIISPLWTIILRTKLYLLSAQVIWVIGASMIFLALMLNFKPKIILITSLAIIFFHNLFDQITFGNSLIWSLVHVYSIRTIENHFIFEAAYPLIPWIAVMSLGYCYGYFLWNSENKNKISLQISILAIALLLILRIFIFYGDPNKFSYSQDFMISLKSFLDTTKYPPSLHYLLTTLPLGILILIYGKNWKNFFIQFIATYGKAPMLYYIAHLCLIVILNFSLVFILSEEKVVTDQLWIIWLATFLIIVALYPLVKKFPDFRKKHVKAWPLLNYF